MNEVLFFYLAIFGLLALICLVFLIAVTAMSFGEWLQGGSFTETFNYCWNNL